MQESTAGQGPSDAAAVAAAWWSTTGEVDLPLLDARVIVVDDLEPNVRLLEKLFRSVGITNVYGFTDPRVFASACADLDPDLVLLDLHMPHMTGLEVLAALRASAPRDSFLPVLVLTADITPEARERALAGGAKDFVTKPFDRTEVLLRSRNLLETRFLYRRMQQRSERLRGALDAELARERNHALSRRMKADRIQAVLDNRDLRCVFQPVVDLETGVIVGYEALARFSDEDRRKPETWFADAEEAELGHELELLAVRTALERFADIPETAFMAINVSPSFATDPALRDALAAYPGARVVLELTEHQRVEDYDVLFPALDELRVQGVRVAIDDTGAGYSGLQHILRMQPDVVKLDLGVTMGVSAEPARRALTVAMVGFAAEIGAVLVAEGIESAADLATLRDLGVAWGQGFHLGLPAPLSGRHGTSRAHDEG